MIPAVTLCSSPSGEPIATAVSPTTMSFTLPITAAGRSLRFTFTTATSVSGSAPIELRRHLVTGRERDVIVCASSTTCAFVMMCPSERRMMPDPVPWTSVDPSSVCWLALTSMFTTHGRAFDAMSAMDVLRPCVAGSSDDASLDRGRRRRPARPSGPRASRRQRRRWRRRRRRRAPRATIERAAGLLLRLRLRREFGRGERSRLGVPDRRVERDLGRRGRRRRGGGGPGARRRGLASRACGSMGSTASVARTARGPGGTGRAVPLEPVADRTIWVSVAHVYGKPYNASVNAELARRVAR